MHLMIPFASAVSEAGQHAVTTLALPNLERLLKQLTPAERDEGDEYSLSPPHERALARALGWHGGDGLLPWGARLAAQDGIAVGNAPWGLVTPAHWNVGAQQVSLVDPQALALDETESRALFEAVKPLFDDEGYTLAYAAPLRWYVSHPSLADLPCASIDRVIGRDVDTWLAADPRLRRIRRLQSEVQMLLYRDATNEAREARGALAVNSFWLSGCGLPQADAMAAKLTLDERLRTPALGEDWAAWAEAWHALDAGPIAQAWTLAQRREPLQLTLCGERHAQRYEARERSLWARLSQAGKSISLPPLLQGL